MILIYLAEEAHKEDTIRRIAESLQLKVHFLSDEQTNVPLKILFGRPDTTGKPAALPHALMVMQRISDEQFTALNDATPAMTERGRAQAGDFPRYFADRCVHFPDFVATVNEELTALFYRRQYSARIRESRAAVCRQYGELAAVLGEAAAELSARAAKLWDGAEKLEKAGFTGQTLERAMELLERTNASILSELLVKMVTRQEKTPSMALYEAENKVRELEAKLGFSPKEPS